MSSPRIAIVGMACEYPDARTPDQLWENVLAQRRSFRRMPPERLRFEDYYAPDPASPDRTYAMQAALIEGYTFDRVRFRVAGATFRAVDLAHWLALDIAARALADAGFGGGEGLPRESTGVLVGNSLTGEFSRAAMMRLRWPYVRRTVDARLAEAGWDGRRRGEFLASLEVSYKSPFAPVGEETLAGGLSNTIAGRICNFFDLHGGGYTVDGACSSSLLSVAGACTALAGGDLDVALAGGVDLSLDPFELVGFAKIGALARDEMRVYDARSTGFWPGEGCGIVVLMREADARAQGRRVHAVIRGWGVSSDGSGGITRPEIDGQLLAIRRAYRRCGYGIDSVAYIEGHGTGTTVGDATELHVLAAARREAGAREAAALGSVKANIGHTKAAAGAAGLIKATLALEEGVLPPHSGLEIPHPILVENADVLRAPTRAEEWAEAAPRRAGVSSMGFGGINVHVTLEAEGATRRTATEARRRAGGTAPQDVELFLVATDDLETLRARLARIAEIAAGLSMAEMLDLAAELSRSRSTGAWRTAIVAGTPAALHDGAGAALERLEANGGPLADESAGVFMARCDRAPRIGFLFPGQGSPSHGDGGAMRRRFPEADAAYRDAGVEGAEETAWTEAAQPAIVAASVAALRVLESMRLDAAVATGHSLGELTALHWGGALSERAVLDLACARGTAMAAVGGPEGAMAGIGAAPDEVATLIDLDPVAVAGLNAPDQTVISGEAEAVRRVMLRAKDRGRRAQPLRVSHAFHSPLMTPSVPILEAHLRDVRFDPLERSVASTVTGDLLPGDADLRDLLVRQITAPVRFTDAVRRLADLDLVIEVGPGRVLTSLAARSIDVPAVSTDAGGPTLRGILAAIGAAWAFGAPVRPERLFDDRLTRPFDVDRVPSFFVNPCELAPAPDAQPAAHVSPSSDPASRSGTPPESIDAVAPAVSADGIRPEDVPHVVRSLVAARAEFPPESVTDDVHLLGDLHLNSIAVGELVVELTRRLGLPAPVAPNEFADATVGGLAKSIQALAENGARGPATIQKLPPGIDAWIRSFRVELVERDRPNASGTPPAPGSWSVAARDDDALAARLREKLAPLGGGVLVCLPEDPHADSVDFLLEGARHAVAGGEGARFVLIARGGPGAAFARTLHREVGGITTCVIHVPARAKPEFADRVAAEVASAAGYTEVHLAADGARRVPVLRLAGAAPATPETKPLSPTDVLLVTGGGKGIAAECALALAKETGVGLALMGRSDPERDPELAANLGRFRSAGLRFGYFVADVTDAAAVRRAVHDAETAVGPITAVLHGAGRNDPRLIRMLDAETVRRTWAPKVTGLENVLAAVAPDRLRLLITFGSIIARIGLRGEADYALANERLTQLTEAFGRRHPGCRCVAIEWSVWSGAGMGERLGRVESLVHEGITPITPDEGTAALRAILRRPELAGAIVVTGRFGDVPTLEIERREPPLRRFLERVRVHTPGVELIADSDLSTDGDPYLDDHVLDGDRLLPAVIGLEAMAEVAMTLAESSSPPVFESVEFRRPVIVPSDATAAIRVAALVREGGVIDVAIRTAASSFQIDHFRATCRFDAPRAVGPAAPSGAPSPETSRARSAAAPWATDGSGSIDPDRDLYGSLLFQRGRFRRLRGYGSLSARACRAELVPDGGTGWFGRFLPPGLVLGDPGARDAALHAIQACIPHIRVLPVRVDRIVTASLGHADAVVVRAREIRREGRRFFYEMEMIDAGGRVLERWEGLCLHAVGEAPRPASWNRTLLSAYLERRFEELIPGGALRVAVESGADPRSSDRAMQAAAGAREPIHRRPDGKPKTARGVAVSASHAGALAVAVSGGTEVGCDIEPIVARTTADWNGLLGARADLARAIADERHELLDVAATRVWAALECLKKAGASVTTPIVLRRAEPDAWVLLEAGSTSVATGVVTVQGHAAPLVVAVACADATKDGHGRARHRG
jgi:enediyne polyketide synthase